MRPTPTLHHAATGRPTEPPAHHLGMAATVDDRDALVRADLIDTATHAGLHCVALVLGLATTFEHWTAVAADFKRAKVVSGSNVSGLYAAHEAAESMAIGSLDGALTYLADGCGLSVEEWVRITRAEQGR